MNSVNQVGIVYSHTYSILNVFEIQGAKLLKLRNPWGSKEWQGDWDKKDKQWTKQLRALAEFRDEDFEKDNGIFCIEINDFLKYFD